jgi:3D (Asp-Asp-Asp) domain-containing protein
MKSTALGSAVSVLLVFSAISYSQILHQEPKAAQQPTQVQTSTQQPRPSVPVTPEDKAYGPELAESASGPSDSPVAKPSLPINEIDFEVAPETYTATAYSLRGRTASGKPVGRGLIAADPSVLPIGTRVRVDAGSFSGEYVVADTGGSVKGRRIDIWTPTAREALQFGRRAVKLTVLSFGGRRSKSAAVRARRVNPLDATAPVAQPDDKREK